MSVSDEQPVQESIPPHDVQAEKGVLGSMLLARRAVYEAEETLGKSDFYGLANREIFDAILTVCDERNTVDPILLRDELKKRGKLQEVGGESYLAELMDAVPTSANVDYYSDIVRKKSRQRFLKKLAMRLHRAADRGDPERLAGQLRELLEGEQAQDISPIKTSEDAAEDMLDEMIRRAEGESTGFTSGITPLDNKEITFERGDLVIISGQPSSGKTSLMHQILVHLIWAHGLGVLLFSTEAAVWQTMCDIACYLSGTNTRAARGGTLPDESVQEFETAVAWLRAHEFLVTGEVRRLDDILTQSRTCCRKHDLGAIGIDFAQQIDTGAALDNRNAGIAEIASSTKALAMETETVIFLLSQVTQLQTGGIRLRWGEELRNASDWILHLQYPEHVTFGESVDQEDDTTRTLQIAKARRGSQSMCELAFYGPHLRFRAPEESNESVGPSLPAVETTQGRGRDVDLGYNTNPDEAEPPEADGDEEGEEYAECPF